MTLIILEAKSINEMTEHKISTTIKQLYDVISNHLTAFGGAGTIGSVFTKTHATYERNLKR